MDTARRGERSHIRPVIHKKSDTLGNQESRKPLRGFKQVTRTSGLVPVLEQTDTGINKFPSAI
jgi:hypothetical protein